MIVKKEDKDKNQIVAHTFKNRYLDSQELQKPSA